MNDLDRKVAKLWLVGNKTQRAIAEVLGLSKSAVTRRVKRLGLTGCQGDSVMYEMIIGDVNREAKISPVNITIPERESVPFDSYDHVSIHWSDVHYPFHDERAVDILYQITDTIKPDILAAQGDMLDLWQLSSHRPPVEKTLEADEIDLQSNINMVAEHLGIMESLAQPDADKYYEDGNHEDRFERSLLEIQQSMRLRYLLAIPDISSSLSIDTLLGLTKRGWKHKKYLTGDNVVLFDRLLLIHGHKTTLWASRSLLSDYGISLMFGHSHRIQNFTKADLNGQVSAWNIGCLCDTNPHWRPHTDWAQGFGVVHWKKVGGKWYFDVHQVRIHDGIGMYNGKVFTA